MIQMTDKYYISANTNCYELTEKSIDTNVKSKKYGQEVYKILGYYVSLEQCINGIYKTELRRFLSKEQVNSIEELKEKMNEIEKSLEKFKKI